MTLTTLIYKYRIYPNDGQIPAIRDAQRQSRKVWNALVGAMKWVESECSHGRKAEVVKNLESILAEKKNTGARAKILNDMLAAGKSRQEAILELNGKILKKADTILRKDGTKAKRASIRTLALTYAKETVSNGIKRGDFSGGSAFLQSILAKFADSTDQYPSNKKGAPRFKRFGDSCTLQAANRLDALDLIRGDKVNLSALFGDSCSRVDIKLHREVPKEAVVKQVGVTVQDDVYHVSLFLDVPEEVAQKNFASANGAVAGIDPGRTSAITISSADGEIQGNVTPPICRNAAFMRRQARLQRKLDRQMRQNNPANYDEKGSIKRGVKLIWKKTKGMIETRRKMNDMTRRLTNVRTEHYRLSARSILSQFDTVGIGHCKGRELAAIHEKNRDGKTAREIAAARRKDADNAVSNFEGILKDFAKRSVTPKSVVQVNEAYTTRTCIKCENVTGPKDTSVREWTCSCCGSVWGRDYMAAQAIAQKTERQISESAKTDKETAGTHPVSKSGSTSVVGKLTRGRKRRCVTKESNLSSRGVPVNQKRIEATQSIHCENSVSSAASAAMQEQLPVGARATQVSAVEWVGKPILQAEPVLHLGNEWRSRNGMEHAEAK